MEHQEHQSRLHQLSYHNFVCHCHMARRMQQQLNADLYVMYYANTRLAYIPSVHNKIWRNGTLETQVQKTFPVPDSKDGEQYLSYYTLLLDAVSVLLKDKDGNITKVRPVSLSNKFFQFKLHLRTSCSSRESEFSQISFFWLTCARKVYRDS